MFKPDRKYQLAEIEQIAGNPVTRDRLSYATIYSVLDAEFNQYDFILYPYNDGDGYILVSVNGEVPNKFKK